MIWNQLAVVTCRHRKHPPYGDVWAPSLWPARARFKNSGFATSTFLVTMI